MTVEEALRKYIEREEPHLAIKNEGLSEPQMENLGFELINGFWVISLEDARNAVAQLDGIDYDKHWEWERKRDWGFKTG